MLGVLALPAVLLALAPFHGSSEPLPQPVRAQLKAEGFWRSSCPVGLDGLRLLTVSHWGFDGRAHTGQLVVMTAPEIGNVFAQLVRRGLRDAGERARFGVLDAEGGRGVDEGHASPTLPGERRTALTITSANSTAAAA